MPKEARGDSLVSARRALKSIEELSKTYKLNTDEILAAQKAVMEGYDPKALEKYVKQVEKLVKNEQDRLKILEAIKKSALDRIGYSKAELADKKELERIYSSLFDAVEEIDNIEKAINRTIDARKALYREVQSALSVIIKQQQEIFKTSHEMQLQGNMTWREYTRAYDEAYKAARRMNAEIGQQLMNAKDMIDMQNALLKEGWRGIDVGTLTDVAASMRMVSTTLGVDFPASLATALQSSYKQFGDQTDVFITALGNRMNAFSDNLGVNIGMLTGIVDQMFESTSFLARNNMEAQIRANESLMRAAALSGAIGLTSTDFISSLALTAQFGTADEMADIYSGGALLTNFDVGTFQQQLMGDQAAEAISQLFGSIHDTMASVQDNHYLRNEYMKMIGSSFGLSQADLLQIMTHGGDLEQYDDEIQEKLLNVNTSMVDELRGLKIDLLDQIETFWTTNAVSQGFGKIMQELGLVGTIGELRKIKGTVAAIAGMMGYQNSTRALKGLTSGAGNMMGPIPGGLRGTPLLGSAALTKGVGAVGLVGSQMLGSSIQQNTSMSSAGANILGGLTNIAGGAASGALIGGVPGAVIGAGIGLINTLSGASERKSRMQELKDQSILEKRKTTTASTGDHLLDAINRQTDVLEGAITGGTQSIVRFQTEADLFRRTTTYGNLIEV